MRGTWVWTAGSILAAGCPAPEAGTAGLGGPTYWRDAAPILALRCAPCHPPDAPLPLDTFDNVRDWADPIATAIAGPVPTMPPWPPAPTCGPSYQADRRLTPSEQGILAAFLANPVEGDRADWRPPPEEIPLQADVILAATPYTPVPAVDDYRCFAIEWPLSEDRTIIATEVVPGERVHHVVVSLAGPDSRFAIAALDAEDAEVGWSCFGGTGLPFGSDVLIGEWVPGAGPLALPEGTGIPVAAGAAVLLRVHYAATGATLPDRTAIHVATVDGVSKPAASVIVADPAWVQPGGMVIPAGASNVVHEALLNPLLLKLLAPDLALGPLDAVAIHRVGLHLHALGEAAEVAVVRADGSRHLLDIPDWDPNWQGSYGLVAPVTLWPADRLALTCRWTNAAPDAVDVAWGGRIADEMCASGLVITGP